MCKDIEKSLSLSNYGVDLPEYEFISYEIETENLMFPGNKYNIFGNEFIVSKVVTTLKRNYLHQRVKLVRENGMIEGLIKNEKIEGVSLRGKILEVNGALVKVHLNIDKEQNKGEAYNFSYTTPHSAGGNTGWYMMPKVEEEVEVHFPLNYEERAYARGTSRTSSKSLPNAGTKELNVHGRNMTMDGSAVTFNAKNDKEGQVHIKTTKGKGVEITSLYDIHLGADGDFALDSKSISMSCGQEFIMMCKGSSLYIDKDTYHFAGTVLKKEGIIKAPIPPFPENKVEEPKKEEPKKEEKDTSMGTLDWIQAGLAVVGMLSMVPDPTGVCEVIGGIASIADAGICAYKGDWAGAGLSLIGAIPIIGASAKLAKATKLTKFAKVAKLADKATEVDKVINNCKKFTRLKQIIMVVGTATAGYTIGTCAYKLATGQKLTNKEKVQLILSITAIGTLWKIAKSDPVDAIKGDVYVESEDFALTGNIPLSWTRYYRSSSENIGHCGLGWSTPADARIELSREIGLLIFYDGGDVPKHFIDLPEDGETSYELVSGDKLTRVKNEYQIKLKNGLTYIIPIYNEDDEVMYVGRIEDSFGNYTEYSRVNNILKTIKESSGRVISVESRNGLITGLYLNDNGAKRTLVRYEYSEKHELLKVYDGENLPHEHRYKNGVMISCQRALKNFIML